MLPPISSWSHSRLGEFEKCKRKIYLMQVEKIPEPERPLPPGKTEHANDRGSRVHDECEQYIRGTGSLPIEANKFRVEFEALRELFVQGKVSLEGEWGMDRAWNPCAWSGEWTPFDDIGADFKKLKSLPERGKVGEFIVVDGNGYTWTPPWLRLKLDALVFDTPTSAIAIDYKTGKKFGNEIKHSEQLQLYQLVTFLRYPQLETITTELWYLDQDDLTGMEVPRLRGLRHKDSWDRRGNKLTTCDEFPPNPNIHSCKYCPYGPTGTGHCPVGFVTTPFGRR